MEPTLVAGQGLVALRWWPARKGQFRCVEHPEQPGFWLVKRVASVAADGTMRVTSDNRAVRAVDSRQFGAVPVKGTYRVLMQIPLRLM